MMREELEKKAKEVRSWIIRSVAAAGSGHPGGSLSAADIVTCLYFDEMKIDPERPDMPERDRFILSKGHAAPVQYAALALRGFSPTEELLSLRKMGSHLQGHPSLGKLPGIEMSTGSLGQGFSVCCGLALGLKIDESPARVYALLGDGELQEGIIWEAAMSAAHYKLSNLCAIIDFNGLQIDGKTSDVMNVAPIAEKFRAFGWNVLEINGHDMGEIMFAFDKARTFSAGPTAIIAKTIKGKGVSFMENEAGWHGKAPKAEECEQALKEIGGEN